MNAGKSLAQIGHVLGIALLSVLPGCGRDDAKLPPSIQDKRQAAEAIFEKRRQVDKVYLTEKTLRRVIRSGNVTAPFVDEDTGELCWPALICTNPDCSGEGEGEFPYLFIHNDPLVTVGSNGEPVYPEVGAGQDYAKMVADAGGFPVATCPACYEQLRQGKTETPEQKNRFVNHVKEYETAEATRRRWELDREMRSLVKGTNSGGDLAARKPPLTPVSSPQVYSVAVGSDAAGSDEQRAVSLAKKIKRPMVKGGVDPETTEFLRQVLEDSDDAQVRAAIIRGLGKARDPDSVPQLLDVMEDESEEMRELAADAVQRTCGFPRLFQADAPLEERQEVITRYRKIWDDILNAPGQHYIRMLKEPGYKEELGRRSMERLKELKRGKPVGQR